MNEKLMDIKEILAGIAYVPSTTDNKTKDAETCIDIISELMNDIESITELIGGKLK